LSGGGPAGQLLLMIVRTRFRRRFFSLLPFLSSFDRSPFGSSLFPSPLLRLVGAGGSGRAASVGILQFSHTVCWTVCDYRTRTLSFCFLFRIFSSALVRAYFRCFASLSPPTCIPFLHPFLFPTPFPFSVRSFALRLVPLSISPSPSSWCGCLWPRSFCWDSAVQSYSLLDSLRLPNAHVELLSSFPHLLFGARARIFSVFAFLTGGQPRSFRWSLFVPSKRRRRNIFPPFEYAYDIFSFLNTALVCADKTLWYLTSYHRISDLN
jgi:hypothetical protein